MTTGKLPDLTEIAKEIEEFAKELCSESYFETVGKDPLPCTFRYGSLKTSARETKEKWLFIAQKYRKQSIFTGKMQRSKNSSYLKPFSWGVQPERTKYLQ